MVRQLEKTHQQTVVDLGTMFGWLVYHTYDSRKSAPGFPDLVMVRKQRIIYAELKTDTGKLSFHQKIWLAALQAAGAEVYVWRPRDLDEIVQVLSRRERPPREQVAA